MLTGHPPFHEGTLPQRLMMHQREPPPSVYDDRPDAPEDLVEVCLRMMAKKPDDRPQSASEVAQLMADWLTAHGHSFDSGSGTGSGSGSSSGRLAAAAAEVGRAVAAGEGRKPQARQPGSGVGPAPQERAPKSDTAIRRAKPVSPGSSPGPADTTIPPKPAAAKQAGKPATAGKTSKPPRRASAGGTGAGAKPPVVASSPAEPEADAFRFLAQDDSPALARFRSRYQLSSEQVEAYRARRKGPPVWVWAAIGVGGLLALALLVILVVGG
jgi:serine/threonine-protein kinase